MSHSATAGPRWLDSLARWAARGQGAPLRVHEVSPSPAPHGLSRRAVLQAAAGAALLAGPLRLVFPVTAQADAASEQACRSANFKQTYDAFQACVKDPLYAFELSRDSITADTESLKTAKSATVRRRFQMAIDSAKRTEARAVKQLESCNAKWTDALNSGEAACHAANPQAGGGGAHSGGGCDPGYLLCGGDCCDPSYSHCGGCVGSPVCCRNGATCCNQP